eukprot:g19639.t1
MQSRGFGCPSWVSADPRKAWKLDRIVPSGCRGAGRPSTAPRKAAEEVKLSSVRQSTVNLVKNIVGAGMLSLPAGVAAFSSSPKAVLPSLVLALLAAFFSAYGFVLIAEACAATGESTYTRTLSPLHTSLLLRPTPFFQGLGANGLIKHPVFASHSLPCEGCYWMHSILHDSW